MKILVISSNGREHALAQKYSESRKVKKVYLAPGNGLSDFSNKKIENRPELQMTDIENLVAFAKKEKIDLVDVPQEDCLAEGYVNRFQKEGIAAFGPTGEVAELESSKEWARNFMMKYKLPIPYYQSFNNEKKALKYVNSIPEQLLYIKASGLAFGKGAIRAENKEQAVKAIKSMKQFGKSGEIFLIEEGLVGEEFSLFVICDGKDYVIVKAAQDHKTIYNKNKGPNTGGIGCVAPTNAVNKKILQETETKIIKPLLKGMQKEKRPYKGILYVGGIITHSKNSGQAKGVKIIEFNCRWGDPEAEVILPSIKTDYVDIVTAVLEQKLSKLKITFDNKIRVSVCGCSLGYPNDYSKIKGKEIFALEKAMLLPGITIFGSGIKRKGKRFFVNGGRVFHLVAEGETLMQARVRAYGAMSMMYIEGNNLHYRTDIGWREMERNIQ